MLDRQARGLSNKTISDYNKSLKKFESDTGITDLSQVNKTFITQWVNSMNTLKVVTANKYIRDIRAFLYYHMEESDLTPFKVKLLKGQETPLKYYTDEELQRLIPMPQHPTFTDYRTWVMICIALGTGARLSTILNINYEDIDWQKGLLTYRHTKNKAAATVPVSAQLLSILRRYTTVYNLDTGSVCPDVYGGILTPNAAHQALETFCEARGVYRHSWHGFRHSFARTWILQGGDVVRLQAMMQHSDISQTAHYARIFGADLRGTEQFTALEQVKTKKHKFK